MNPTTQEVNVLSYYFTRGAKSRCFPRKIEVEGREIGFLESGLRCLVGQGKEIFNMTDGDSLYRLSFTPQDRTWTLLSSRTL